MSRAGRPNIGFANQAAFRRHALDIFARGTIPRLTFTLRLQATFPILNLNLAFSFSCPASGKVSWLTNIKLIYDAKKKILRSMSKGTAHPVSLILHTVNCSTSQASPAAAHANVQVIPGVNP